jgi:hypothetical protein
LDGQGCHSRWYAMVERTASGAQQAKRYYKEWD